MTKLAFSVAAMLLASSAAFAGSDHYGNEASRPAVDTNATASVSHNKVDTRMKTGSANYSVKKHGVQPVTKSAADEPGQGIWGN